MHVFFDRTISLRQGNSGAEPAKVRKLVCDQDVRVEDQTFAGSETNRKLVKVSSLRAPVLHMDSLAPDQDYPGKDGKPVAGNKVVASGPGLCKVWERGGSNPLSTGATPGNSGTTAGPAPRKKAEETKMTCIWFQRRMDANNQTNMAYFWEKVRVLNLPCDRPDREMNLDVILAGDLPEGAMYLSCSRLKVLDRPSNGKPNKQMEAHENVYAQGREFWARCGSLYYNQAKDQIILEAGTRGTATLYRQNGRNGRPETTEAQKIIYNRSTGEAQAFGIGSISGSTTTQPR
jgi:hypothetical protein